MAATTMGMRTGSRCPVCFGGMGHGQAIFTAECSHAFHLRCVPSRSICPVCAARWPDAPSSPEAPSAAIEPMYGDDDPVEPPPAHAPLDGGGRSSAAGLLVLKTHCEYPALAKAAAHDGFGVVVHAKAPAAVAAPESSASSSTSRAPLDLVTVLDVSTSMAGEKLELVKRAMAFLIDNLGAGDRLSVVAFSTDARRVLRLTRMSGDGKAAAKRAVASLASSGCTNIRDGLDVATAVLDGRRHRNAVASVILLSDGQDNQSTRHGGGFGGYDRILRTGYDVLVPPPFVRTAGGDRCAVAVHAFGFGTDHDAAAMHYISEVTGGTFSFIENHAGVQDAFARCAGGLLSVAVQKARVSLECVHAGVRVRAVNSGSYETRIDAAGRAVTVHVGELYADEERRFLLSVDVPRAHSIDELATHLFRVRCTYLDTATGETVDVAGEDAVVLRPFEAPAEVAPNMEVERERVRVAAAEDMALARAAAERGNYAEAARILDARREKLTRSAPALSGDAMCTALVTELSELRRRVCDEREYEKRGRAFFLAGMSSQAQQRGASVYLDGGGYGKGSSRSASAVFATPAMRKMEKLSQLSREQKQEQATTPPMTTTTTPQPENGSTAGPPRWRLDARLAAAAAPRLSMLRKYRRLMPLKR